MYRDKIMKELDSSEWQQRLEETERLYLELLVISEKQKAFIKAFNVDAEEGLERLQELLQERETLMKRIDGVNIRQEEEIILLKVLENETSTERWQTAKKMHQDYRQNREELKQIIGAIQDNDQKTQGMTEEAMKELGMKLAHARETAKATRAYTQYGATSEAWFFDKKK